MSTTPIALHAVNQQLQHYFAAQPQAGEGLVTVLEDSLSLPRLLPLLQALLADADSLQTVATRSYVHGNGFVKVVLLDEHGYKLRLHIWFAGSACEENIHDHRWSFASHVLVGTLNSEIWVDDVQGQVLPEFRYAAATANSAAGKQAVGHCRLSLQQHCQYGAGSSYVMPKLVLHRIINPGQHLVATVMVSAPTEQGDTRLIPIQEELNPQVDMPRLSAEALAPLLRRFINECQSQAWSGLQAA